MQTTFIQTADGRNVRSDLVGDPNYAQVSRPIISDYKKRKAKDDRENVLNKKLPRGTKIKLPMKKDRELFPKDKPKLGRRPRRKKPELPGKISVPVFPPRQGRPVGHVPSNKGTTTARSYGSKAKKELAPDSVLLKTLTKRACLCCHKPFPSEGSHNRLCNPCRHLSPD